MKRDNGFSLIEVLVTLVIISIGIMVMLSLQAKSIQYTQDSVNKNTAVNLSAEIAEIIRAYRDEVFEKKPPKQLMYSELKSNSLFYSSGGISNFGFSSSDCPESNRPQTAKQAGGCWLKKAQGELPGINGDSSVQAKIKICPSFSVNAQGEINCANNYTGSTLGIQLAWKSKDKVCGINSNSDVCTYYVRVEI